MTIIEKILPKKEADSYYLILSIKEEEIFASIIKTTSDRTIVVGSGKSKYIEGKNELEAADIAISSAEKDLPDDILTEKVIFVIPHTYIDKESGKIKKVYLDRLQKISKELELKPEGFVEYSQAISYFLKDKEESPVSAILIAFESEKLILSLVRVGKVKKNLIISKSKTLSDDIEKALFSLSEEILPSRIIVYDGKESLRPFKRELLEFPWHKHSSFIHTPKIETLDPDELNEAVVKALGNRILYKMHGIYVDLPESSALENEKPEREEDKKSAKDFGFVKGKDIKESTVKPQVYQTIEKTEDAEDKKSKAKKLSLSTLNLPKIPKIDQPAIKFLSFPKASFIWAGILIFVLLSFSGLYLYYPKATVVLIVYPRVVTETIDVTFAASPPQNKKYENLIKADKVEVEVKGEETTKTSGTTRVGKPASGKVLVYNKTTEQKSFSKGETLKANDLLFTLDSDITVASASDTGESLEFGKEETSITALEIGPEGNLPEATEFTFEKEPKNSYYAKSIGDFSGGTSREISTVSDQDKEKLISSLSKELISQAREKLANQVPKESLLIEQSLQEEVAKEVFSHEKGDETKKLTLNLTLMVAGFAYKRDDIENISEKATSAQLADLALTDKYIKVLEDEKVEITDGIINTKALVVKYFQPEINFEEIKTNIKGKSYNQAASYLSSNSKIGGVQIFAEHRLPFRKDFLPVRQENLIVRVKSIKSKTI